MQQSALTNPVSGTPLCPSDLARRLMVACLRPSTAATGRSLSFERYRKRPFERLLMVHSSLFVLRKSSPLLLVSGLKGRIGCFRGTMDENQLTEKRPVLNIPLEI